MIKQFDFRKILLFIIPITFFIFSQISNNFTKNTFTTNPDPPYIYLINGANIAGGNFVIGHYDNPGTPLHLFTGFIIFTTHFFIDGLPVTESVLNNPEIYLTTISIFFAVLILFTSLFSSIFIFKHTNDLSTSVLFQILPTLSHIGCYFLFQVRLCPETFMIICLPPYFAFLWVIANKDSNFISKKELVLTFAIANAILIMTKATLLPLFFVPFFFIKDLKSNIWYVFLFIIFSFLVIFPIWPNIPDMYHWFVQIATKPGHYGTSEGTFTFETFKENLTKLLDAVPLFSWVLQLAFLFLLILLFKKSKKSNLLRLQIALLLICALQLIMASKQYSNHYILASHLLIIPIVISVIKQFSFPLFKTIYVAFTCVVLFYSGIKVKAAMAEYCSINQIFESQKIAKKYASIPKVITTGYEGTCFNESSLRFGACYGGPNFSKSKLFLKNRYPNFYFYDLFLNVNYVSSWDEKILTQKLLSTNSSLLFYFIRMDENKEREAIDRLIKGYEPFITKYDLVENIEATREHFYLLEIDTTLAKSNYATKIEYKFDFEKKDNQNFYTSSNGLFKIQEGNKQTSLNFTSGSKSIEVENGMYFLNSKFKVNAGDELTISANYLSKIKPPGISVSNKNSNFEMSSESIFQSLENGWNTVSLNCVIPNNFSNSILDLSFYYFGEDKCYIDDLIITHKKNNISETRINNVLDKSVLLKANGKNISIGGNGNLSLVTQPSSSYFKIKRNENLYSILGTNNKYITSDRVKNNLLFCDRENAWDWEKFVVHFVDSNSFVLKSTNKFYVEFTNGSFIASAKTITNACVFHITEVKR